MQLTNDNLVQNFWIEFSKANSKTQFKRILHDAESKTVELMATLEGDDFFSFYDNSPLLSIVSEVLFACPEAVEELIEENTVIAIAYELLGEYTDLERKQMQHLFLPRNNNIIPFKTKE